MAEITIGSGSPDSKNPFSHSNGDQSSEAINMPKVFLYNLNRQHVLEFKFTSHNNYNADPRSQRPDKNSRSRFSIGTAGPPPSYGGAPKSP